MSQSASTDRLGSKPPLASSASRLTITEEGVPIVLEPSSVSSTRSGSGAGSTRLNASDASVTTVLV